MVTQIDQSFSQDDPALQQEPADLADQRSAPLHQTPAPGAEPANRADYGERLRGCNARGMKPKAAQDLSPELKRALEPLLMEIESASERIQEYDQMLESMARNRYPEVERLKQIKGVGTLIGLAYMLTLEDPTVFARAGMLPAMWDSNLEGATRDRASHRCTLARRAIRICELSWCRLHTTFSVLGESTATCVDGGCD